MTEKLLKNLELTVRTPEQLGAALLRFRKLVSWTQQEAVAQAAVTNERASLLKIWKGCSKT